MWDSYIYLKVVVTDEKIPEDSGLVEIAQPDHVFNSLIGNILVVAVVPKMTDMTKIMMMLIIMIVMTTSMMTLMTSPGWMLCCVV